MQSMGNPIVLEKIILEQLQIQIQPFNILQFYNQEPSSLPLLAEHMCHSAAVQRRNYILTEKTENSLVAARKIREYFFGVSITIVNIDVNHEKKQTFHITSNLFVYINMPLITWADILLQLTLK